MSNPTHLKPVPAASTPDGPPAFVRSLPAWAAPAALGAILVLAAVLYGWALGSLGWANSYYSAAVKSMGTSWTNFLFGSFDPAGVITVDKPPAALWPQVISSKIFGLHGWALVLPQMIEGVAAVLVLHRTVRRWAGEGAALVAALVLTLTPITVAINRDNNPDTLLVLLLVSAAYALTRALQAEGRTATWWLCASGFLIGCGFLTKMLAAWMVIPAFTLAWLVGGSGPWIPRVRRLLGAGAILAASSLWWVAMVALWPGDRPYIGGSKDGSAWDLVVGYNGLGRVFGSSDGMSQSMGGFGGGFGGASGLGRLFNAQVGPDQLAAAGQRTGLGRRPGRRGDAPTRPAVRRRPAAALRLAAVGDLAGGLRSRVLDTEGHLPPLLHHSARSGDRRPVRRTDRRLDPCPPCRRALGAPGGRGRGRGQRGLGRGTNPP
ncbi:glycosyltransferase family 39 protein [Streptomyces sp. ATCC 21386]|uniref:ArnT family glycosyltransferase n=1 Tax=Streptomyces sp. ATCC 21386 TaxID=2699428 RepID=UPI002044D215|nr:glycosyltransferase family 39 protein [Streptomyces sp. ATCC 21386]